MNKNILYLTFFLSGFLIFCNENGAAPNQEDSIKSETLSNGIVKLSSSSARRNTNPDVSMEVMESVAEGNNTFALNLYDKLSVSEPGNIFFSPYSINAAVAMAYAGAEGETKEEIEEAMCFNLQGDDFHQAFNALQLDLDKADTSVTLRVSNAAWGQKGWPFKPTYFDILAENYGSGLFTLDFKTSPNQSRIIINDWVYENTNEKIEDLLPQGSISSMTRLVLTNAIYFYGDWLEPFDTSRTDDRDFYLKNGDTVSVPMMFHDKESYRYYSGSEVKAVELPYKGERIVMDIFLPENEIFDAFEQSLDYSKMNEIIDGMNSTRVVVSMPKFEFTTNSIPLTGHLSAMGMESPFDSQKADFSGMDSTGSLFISSVVHKAFVKVDEKGTEAAAATGVIIGTTSVQPDYEVFSADSPFIFCIRDTSTNTILFMGRVLDPR